MVNLGAIIGWINTHILKTIQTHFLCILQVRPLTGAEVQATTDLLTEVFATLGGPGWNVYTRYMRNQIHRFLEVRPRMQLQERSSRVLLVWKTKPLRHVS